jgi:hypothetical protein
MSRDMPIPMLCNITVSGAVFAKSFYSQRLVDSMFIGPRGEGPDDAIRRAAVLVRAVQRARKTLDDYYEKLGKLQSPLTLSFIESSSTLQDQTLKRVFPYRFHHRRICHRPKG